MNKLLTVKQYIERWGDSPVVKRIEVIQGKKKVSANNHLDGVIIWNDISVTGDGKYIVRLYI